MVARERSREGGAEKRVCLRLVCRRRPTGWPVGREAPEAGEPSRVGQWIRQGS